MPVTAAPPRWNMTTIFPSLDSAEFSSAMDQAVANLGALEGEFDARKIVKRDGPTGPDDIASFELLLPRRNALADELRVLDAFINGFVTTDSRDALAQEK